MNKKQSGREKSSSWLFFYGLYLAQASSPIHRFRLCGLEAGDFLDRLNQQHK